MVHLNQYMYKYQTRQLFRSKSPRHGVQRHNFRKVYVCTENMLETQRYFRHECISSQNNGDERSIKEPIWHTQALRFCLCRLCMLQCARATFSIFVVEH